MKNIKIVIPLFVTGTFLIFSGCMKFFSDWSYREYSFDFKEIDSTSACVFENGNAIIGGKYSDNYTGVSTGKIYLYTKNTNKIDTVYQNAGFIDSVGCKDNLAWGIKGKRKKSGYGSSFTILRSVDSGRTWKEYSEIPPRSASRILIISSDEAWFLGPGLLIKTLDGGKNWHEIHPNGKRNSIKENLSYFDKKVYLTGDNLQYTEDGGTNWHTIESEASRYYIVDNDIVLAKVNSEIQVGRIGSKKIQWFHSFDGDFKPYRMVVTGSVIRFLATPSLDLKDRWKRIMDVGDGILLFESHDNGSSWSEKKIPGRPTGNSTDIAGDKAGFSLGPYLGIYTP